MRSSLFPIIFILVLVFVDIYAFKGARQLMVGLQPRWRTMGFVLYWLVPLLLVGSISYMMANRHAFQSEAGTRAILWLMGFFVLFYLPKLLFAVFHLGDDLVHGMRSVLATTEAPGNGEKITRQVFFTRIGLGLATLPFVGVLYGIIKGRFDYRVSRQVLRFPDLPANFDGFRIVQVSDIHIGSFLAHKKQVAEAIRLVNEQDADVLLFTGDMVNNAARELDGWEEILGRMRARHFKAAVLGNHDYGDYANWESMQAKKENLMDLVAREKKMGFKVLLNDAIRLERDGQQLAIMGVENWGLPPFPQHGDLDKAYNKVQDVPFKVLMSHDPTHWDNQVLGRDDIKLTLSGHTHGMQFGIHLPFLKWSPVKYKYPRWAGLYKEGKQYLYVNRGFGFIAFPGRVGMPPEITVLELAKDTNT